MQLNKFASIPHPAADYAADYLEATRRIAAWPGNGTSNIIDPCQVQFLTHQDKAERAIVLFHGYTACPDQFYRLGTTFHNLGYNVLIPRMRYHGRRDRLTSSQARLTAATLVAVANDAVDIAHGLGRQVQVMGLSMGGVMAAWVAQNRADVERV
ncbi:MAG: alpha/beta hydrolase, partial [Anaerolineae bacterium]